MTPQLVMTTRLEAVPFQSAWVEHWWVLSVHSSWLQPRGVQPPIETQACQRSRQQYKIDVAWTKAA
jgi:hypothetical protein